MNKTILINQNPIDYFVLHLLFLSLSIS